MSGDWFEEAIKDLDEVDPDAEPADIPVEDEQPEEPPAANEPTDDDETIADDASSDSDEPSDLESETETEVQTDESEMESPDDAGLTDDDTEGADDDTTQTDDDSESDPFGFGSGGSDDTNASAANTPSADEFDADSGGAAEFGFDAADATDGPTAGDDSMPAGDREPSPATESSMAQSPEEFGFSLQETDDASGPGAPTPAADDTAMPEPSPEPQSEPSPETQPESPAPTDDQPDDDPFGFGSGASGGGGSTPAMEGDGDDDFGFGGFGGGGGGGAPAPSGPEEFDDEEFESEIDRIDLGIKGLDDMILGGVPERSLIGIIGGAGTGKTTFALQFLNQALTQGQRAVFITLEQTEEAVLSTAEEKGWPFRQYVEDDMLAIVVLDPVEMANSLASIRGDISRLIREFGASRLVLDSVSLLEMMYDHPAKRRSEIFDFTRSLKEAGVTTLLTSEASEDSSHASRYGAVEYLTDAVFVLRYVRTSNFEETRLAIEIQKIRDANHSRATKPYDLTDEGMSVHKQANIF